ncbi:unnamed protein product [Polarella glacialis]|uniref:Methyltransferase domain-containing protein n=1 Tax=Polarella glacialis TaxID=89957 RepID=A0A813KUN5_POLGL|nr:unnamed protein product [Polarella glacialis]
MLFTLPLLILSSFAGASGDALDRLIFASFPEGNKPGGPNLLPGRELEGAQACFDGWHFSHDICCCGPRHMQRDCWGTTKGGSWTHKACCVWQNAPGQMCYSNSTMAISFDSVGLLQIMQNLSDESGLCKVFCDWYARFLDTSGLVESLQRFFGRKRLRVLDLGAGVGLEAVIWAKRGQSVTALDAGECQVRHIRQNAIANGVHLQTLRADLAEAEVWTDNLRSMAGHKRGFDVIYAVGMDYLPIGLYHKLLDVIDAVASDNFVWPMHCSRGPEDLYWMQSEQINLAATRFEVVDAAVFRNIGNPHTRKNLMNLTRVCFLQRRKRHATYRFPDLNSSF